MTILLAFIGKAIFFGIFLDTIQSPTWQLEVIWSFTALQATDWLIRKRRGKVLGIRHFKIIPTKIDYLHQAGLKVYFGFGSTFVTRCKFLGALAKF